MNKLSSQTAGTLGIGPPEKSPTSPEEAAPHSQLFNCAGNLAPPYSNAGIPQNAS